MGITEDMSDRFDHSKYVSITMEFRCNLKCAHCMIEGTMDDLVPQSRENFNKLMAFNAENQRWKGLILTGSEITLLRDLPELAQQAKASNFDHVRIQTHGMHLAQPSYCDTLIQAGVDEFFVSVTASNAQAHDEITTVKGSYDKTIKGLENLKNYDHVISITNTVVTKNSYTHLPALVKNLSHLKHLIQFEFWTYMPMSESDTKDLIANHQDILPYLKEAIQLIRASGRSVEVKNFPPCLLGNDGKYVVNYQPQLFIDENFWIQFERNQFAQCVYQDTCKATDCLGLTEAYIKKFGFEEDILSPIQPTQ